MTFEIFVLISEETRNKQKRCVSNFLRSIDQEDLYSGNCFALDYQLLFINKEWQIKFVDDEYSSNIGEMSGI